MEAQATKRSGEPVCELLRPLWRSTAIPPSHASLPGPDLNGMTIGAIWYWLCKGDEMFPIIRETLRKRYPAVKFVEDDVFGNSHGQQEYESVAALPEKLLQHGVDAVISGVGI